MIRHLRDTRKVGVVEILVSCKFKEMIAMQVLLLISGLFYVAVMPILFISWLEFFHHDRDNLTHQEQQISMLIIAIATLLWAVVLPFAYLELLDRFKRSSRTARLYKAMMHSTRAESLGAEDGIQFSNY